MAMSLPHIAAITDAILFNATLRVYIFRVLVISSMAAIVMGLLNATLNGLKLGLLVSPVVFVHHITWYVLGTHQQY